MLGDSSVALKIETVCFVSLSVFCTDTVGGCFSDGRTDGHREIRRGCGMHLANGQVVIWYQAILL
jgi:hypothetical protein